MAHIAIVHVPDDHTADAIIAGEVNVGNWGSGVRIVGLYKFPDRAELRNGCPGCTRPPRKISGWGRAKEGWMRCASCDGRNPKVRRWFVGALFDWFGANRYPKAPALFRTPEGYGFSDHADND